MKKLTRCNLILGLGLLAIAAHQTQASEFPERECCDPVYPLPAPPASTTPYPSAATPTGRSGPNVKTAVAILNCLLARQLCFEDASCSAILEIIPRVCGSELVACSTVTVTKCQAALRTLQAFPFFRPTCLCREPHVDPECNSFRDFLFDHPCIFVLKKEKDPYPVDALPTCNHALSVCQQERKCIKLFEDFKTNCKVRDGKCRMDDRELCHEAWTKLRLSPMFGCICPNNHMKRRCDRIFSMVNHNPCVDALPASFDLSGTDSALYPYDPEQGNFRDFLFPPATNLYPYFLFPSNTLRPRLSHSPPHYPATHTDTHLSVEDTLNIPLDYDETDGKLTSSHSGSISVKVISSENATTIEGIESQLENPLVGIRGTDQKDDRHEQQGIPSNGNNSLFDEDGEPRGPSITPELAKVHPSSEPEGELPRNFSFQSTCHLALELCNSNYSCKLALHPVLRYCDMNHCSRESCMDALQSFYRTAELKWSLEIAFCLCKKTENKQDECLVAQEKLHPVCAQRVEGSAMPTCHSLAEFCREELSCRNRLEYYEQSCAVDSLTKKCAGPPSECRKAMLGILGTELRSNCACKGTDFTQLYDCLGWQRLLWVNPCVVESQKDYHTKRSAEGLQTTTTSTTTSSTSSTWRPHHLNATSRRVTPAAMPTATTTPGEAPASTELEVPSTTPSTTTTTTTTLPPRFCAVHRDHSVQYIREGKGKRLYREDEPECSELCQCNEGESLSCNTVCVERAPCKTDFAFYNHAAPAYQAYRGRCLCYSGRFICMRPTPDAYKLPQGVFLFLGYSETDEALLKPHSNLSIQDAVGSLQDFMRHESSNKTSCTLALYNVTRENLILMAKISKDSRGASQRSSLDLLMREKEECAGPLHDISEKINSHHPELHSHLLLSIFKMAEVEVKVPDTNTGSHFSVKPSAVLLVVLAVLAS
ncbi:uncharacterized protein Gfrl isoform X1 [Periplaneta americana]|uniref:uncharacterized protein Gfrl isoform X1 n=1 Tax=Periplaneta americana TaxID=6978 RepID=UPI0037E89661